MKLVFLRDLFCCSLTKIQCSHQLCCSSESGGWKAEAAHTWVHSSQSYTWLQLDVQRCHMAPRGLFLKRCVCSYLYYSIAVVWQGRSEFPWISHSISKDLTSEGIKMSTVLCKVTQNSKWKPEAETTYFQEPVWCSQRSILCFIHRALSIYTKLSIHSLTKFGQEIIFSKKLLKQVNVLPNFTCTYISSWEMLKLQAVWMWNIT